MICFWLLIPSLYHLDKIIHFPHLYYFLFNSNPKPEAVLADYQNILLVRILIRKIENLSLHTPCSKRKYTLCFPVSTQNVAGAGPPAVLMDSQSEFLNNHATFFEEIPNGSKVLRESLLGCCLRKFTKTCFCH